MTSEEIGKIYKIILEVDNIEEYRELVIKKLIEAIFKLKRSIKGRCEDLSPKLAIVGLYHGCYDTYKDKIRLTKEFKEEVIIEEKEENGKRIVTKTVRVFDVPKIEINSEKIINNEKTSIDGDNGILEAITEWLEKSNEKQIIIYKNGIEYKFVGERNE
jgi:hypothetical protein